MEKWRCILGIGIVLGWGIQIVDHFIMSMPNVIFIPLELISIILIFTGFIMRKRR